jgi:hypothetical protein
MPSVEPFLQFLWKISTESQGMSYSCCKGSKWNEFHIGKAFVIYSILTVIVL